MRISQGQYGNRQAVPRIRHLLQQEAIPASFFYPAVSALLYPDEARGVVTDGHEIGIHSWIHEANATLPPGAERGLTFRAADILEQIARTRPVGIRAASWDFSVETLSIIQELGSLYDSSLMADDDAYELESGGQPTGIVELSPEWIRDDAVYFNFVRFSALRALPPHSKFSRPNSTPLSRRVASSSSPCISGHQSPVPFTHPAKPDYLHQIPRRLLVRNPRRHRPLVRTAGRSLDQMFA